jgi:lysophospholipase L1-like esterase
LGLALVSLLAALALAELLVRLLVPQPSNMRFEHFVRGLQLFRWRDYANVIENDPELFWRLVPNRTLPQNAWPLRGVISNSQGLREDHEIPFEKPPGELRVLFLGDSCTFGYGLLHHEGFVYQVEAKLRSEFPQARLECINAGVPGYTLFQGVHFLETRGFRYHPDLIVATFGCNEDSDWDGIGDSHHYGPWLVSQYAPKLRESRLYQIVWTVIDRWINDEAPGRRPRLLPEEFRSLLAQVHEDARRQDAELLLLVWAGPFNIAPDMPKDFVTSYQRDVRTYGQHELRFGPERAAGLVDFVPLVREMVKEHLPSDIFLDHVHGTSWANERFAEAIVKKLTPWVRARLAKQQATRRQP